MGAEIVCYPWRRLPEVVWRHVVHDVFFCHENFNAHHPAASIPAGLLEGNRNAIKRNNWRAK
jgi:hypothetical protein